MKNATKHADDLKSLCKKLVREHKPEPKGDQEPLIALVRGAMSFDVSDHRAADAIKAIEKEFVDLNELRVATDLEIQEMLGQRYPEIERRVRMITGSLNNIFEREHTLSLDRLKTISKRDARKFLSELPDVHPFVEAYVMLHCFDGHAVPIDDEILAMLRDEEVVEEDTDLEEAQRFVEHHLKTGEAYPFFVAARQVAFEEGRKSKKKARS
jgi:endonuclease III